MEFAYQPLQPRKSRLEMAEVIPTDYTKEEWMLRDDNKKIGDFLPYTISPIKNLGAVIMNPSIYQNWISFTNATMARMM